MSLASLNSDVSSLSTLAPKDAGSLIKPVDWNGLVASVEGIGNALIEYIAQTDTAIQTLNDQMNPLIDKVNELETDLDDLKTDVAPLLANYIVTMRTEKVNYAMGELCEITAAVTDLAGNPVSNRPWIDFIVTWGELRVVPGFSTQTGASGSSISVRTDNSGVAKVRVKAPHATNMTESQERQVASALETTLDSGQFVYQAIMAASTPTSGNVGQAFQLMNIQYEQAQQSPIQMYIDSYQQYMPWQNQPQLNPGIFSSWTNHRAIVVAFAKDDSDPTTPDAVKGTSSIQVTFRDWVGPWISGYVGNYQTIIPALIGSLGGQIAGSAYALDLDMMESHIANRVKDLGLVGRQQYYNGVISAIDQLTVTQPPSYMSDLKQTVKQAVTIQQVQESPALAIVGNNLGKVPTMAAVTGVSRQAASAKDVANSTLGSFDAVQAANQALDSKVKALDTDLKVTNQISSTINNELQSIGQNVLKINTLDQNSVKGQINLISSQIGLINETLKRT